MESSTLLIIPIAACLVGGLIAWLLNRRVPLLSGLIALVASGVSFVFAVRVFQILSIDINHPVLACQYFSSSLKLGTLYLGIALRAWHFSSLMFLAIAFSGLLVIIYSLYALRNHKQPGRFYALMLWAIAGGFSVVLADNWMLFIIGWEIVTAAVYLLPSLGSKDATEGMARTFITLGFADACIIIAAFLFLFTMTGPQQVMPPLSEIHQVALDSWTACLIYCLLLVGALAKAGAMPLHKWVPASAAHAHASELALLTGALDKFLGIYLLARISLQMFTIGPVMQVILLVIGCVTILGAVFMAMMQHNIKKLLAYHAVSQLGYLILGLGTGIAVGIVGGLLHMINNAIYKSCLFLGAGAVEDATGEDDLDRLGGLASAMPITFAAVLVAALSISGVPPLSGFASKWMIYQGALSYGMPLGPFLLVVAVFGSALTLASFVKILSSMFFGKKPDGMTIRRPGAGIFFMTLPMTILAGLCLLFGIWYMLPIRALIEPTLAELGVLAPGTSPASLAPDSWPGLWNSGWATVLILVGLVLGLVVYIAGHAFRTRTVPAYMAGEVIRDDRVRLRSSSFYRTVEDLPFIGYMLHSASAGSYDLFNLTRPTCLLRKLQARVLPLCVTLALFVFVIVLFYSLGAALRQAGCC